MVHHPTLRTVSALFLSLIVLAVFAGCQFQVSLKDVQLVSPSLMVAKKVDRVAFIVIDDSRVPNEITVNIDNIGYKLLDFQEFVRRDLKNAFAPFFTEVRVVSSADPIPAGSGVVIDVKIDRLEYVTALNVGRGVMTWSLALRPSEWDEYLYSFAAASSTEFFRPSGLDQMCRVTLEAAINDMLKGYVDKGIQQKLVELDTKPTSD